MARLHRIHRRREEQLLCEACRVERDGLVARTAAATSLRIARPSSPPAARATAWRSCDLPRTPSAGNASAIPTSVSRRISSRPASSGGGTVNTRSARETNASSMACGKLLVATNRMFGCDSAR
jgi:hypothetical protein